MLRRRSSEVIAVPRRHLVFEAGCDTQERNCSFPILRASVPGVSFSLAAKNSEARSLPTTNVALALSISPLPTRQIVRYGCGGGYCGISLSAREAHAAPSAYSFAPKLACASMLYVKMARLARIQPQGLM
jgi:hypothetical protein